MERASPFFFVFAGRYTTSIQIPLQKIREDFPFFFVFAGSYTMSNRIPLQKIREDFPLFFVFAGRYTTSIRIPQQKIREDFPFFVFAESYTTRNFELQIQASLVTTESTLGEAKKQYDSMLETKQMELSRHLKETSQRNDQAINDIRKKFEQGKQDILATEKGKADKFEAETEKKYEQRLTECQDESRTQLAHMQEEHAATKINGMTNEHQVQIKALNLQHEDECRQLQEKLDVQKSKEERQRALLELQWKVMGTPQEEQEVNSKKDYSMSSIKMREPNMRKRRIHTSSRPHIKD